MSLMFALLIFLLTRLAVQHPAWIENNYSTRFYPLIASVLSSITSLLPFSLDDIFYILLIFLGLILIVLFISGKITFKKAGIIVVTVLSITYSAFYILWGFNYFRQNLSERLHLVEQETNEQEFFEILEKLIDETNNSYCNVSTIDKKEINKNIESSYQNFSSVLGIKYPSGKRKDKGITFSTFFAKSGISGYYGPFFNEIHVNKKVLPIEYPFVLAHEKAHQLGITSEAEANFYAWLVCSQSKSKPLQYSANLIILRHFLLQAYNLKEYPELHEQIDDKVKQDFIRIREHWITLRNEKMDKAASKVNDVYLKTNNVEAGIEDYHGVVKHVMNFSLDTTFQKKHKLLPN